jgi:hypothetical protein
VGGCPFKIGGPNAAFTAVHLNGNKAISGGWPGGLCDLSPGHN